MLTCCSLSELATSRSSFERSSATTSTAARNNAFDWSPSHSTSIEARRLLGHQAHGVGAVGAVHRHAAAAGDEADDLVARHRRAAARQAHQHVVEALDVHAGVVARSRGAAARGSTVAGSCSSVVAVRSAAGHLAGDGRGPTRGPRRWPRAASRGRRTTRPRSRRPARRWSTCAAPAGPRGGTPWSSSSRPDSTMSSRRSRENHCLILLRARGDSTNCSQSRVGPADSTFDVKISQVSPLFILWCSGTSRPLTLAPMQRVADLGVHGVGEVDRRWTRRAA